MKNLHLEGHLHLKGEDDVDWEYLCPRRNKKNQHLFFFASWQCILFKFITHVALICNNFLLQQIHGSLLEDDSPSRQPSGQPSPACTTHKSRYSFIKGLKSFQCIWNYLPELSQCIKLRLWSTLLTFLKKVPILYRIYCSYFSWESLESHMQNPQSFMLKTAMPAKISWFGWQEGTRFTKAFRF